MHTQSALVTVNPPLWYFVTSPHSHPPREPWSPITPPLCYHESSPQKPRHTDRQTHTHTHAYTLQKSPCYLHSFIILSCNQSALPPTQRALVTITPPLCYWGTPLGVPQYWFDQTWGKWAIIEGNNFFFINRVVALSGRIWSELPDSNTDGCFQKK